MTNPVAVVRAIDGPKGTVWRHLLLWCPGCNDLHSVSFVGENGAVPKVCWEFDGNVEAPTVSPSLLITARYGGEGPDGYDLRCHSFIRGGRWEFLTDCTHTLAGQTVDLPPLPDWVVQP